jgi:hypothetical protein
MTIAETEESVHIFNTLCSVDYSVARRMLATIEPLGGGVFEQWLGDIGNMIYRGYIVGNLHGCSIFLNSTLSVGIQSPAHSFAELTLFRMIVANRRLPSAESSSGGLRTSVELQSAISSRP